MNNNAKQWLLPALVLAIGLTAVAVIGLIRLKNLSQAGSAEYGGLASAAPGGYANQDVDPGTSAGDAPAPDFRLVDQLGRETSLAQFRGKVVLMAFVDSQCTDICPLTTESMVKALRLLGPAAADVQLLGINANPLALKVSDVAGYTQAHAMQAKWRFLTGSLPQLQKVWREYHVYVATINDDADHQPAMVLIDNAGREHKIYMTQMSYEGVAPQAQVLANDIASLLPGPRSATQKVSLKYVPPLQPTTAVNFHAVGARDREVAVGGEHGHLMLFFATWLGQDSKLAARLRDLDQYGIAAQLHSWPSAIAVDELTTESSTAAARKMLTKVSSGLKTPVVEDPDGRLGDGYQVQDLPWYSLSAPDGKVIWSHDGWLTPVALEQQVRAAIAKSEANERTAAPAKPQS
jgi:cytochrome oxidase Cu insertion factor (SCO1/SenC/PrrC family)